MVLKQIDCWFSHNELKTCGLKLADNFIQHVTLSWNTDSKNTTQRASCNVRTDTILVSYQFSSKANHVFSILMLDRVTVIINCWLELNQCDLFC